MGGLGFFSEGCCAIGAAHRSCSLLQALCRQQGGVRGPALAAGVASFWVYWVGRKVRSGFTIRSYRKTQTNFLAKSIF